MPPEPGEGKVGLPCWAEMEMNKQPEAYEMGSQREAARVQPCWWET